MPTLTELREKRVGLVKQGRELLAKADAEKRELSADENQQFDRIMAEVDAIKENIDKQEKADQRSKWLEEEETAARASTGRRSDPNPVSRGTSPADAARVLSKRDRLDAQRKATLPPAMYRMCQDDYRGAFGTWLKGRHGRYTPEQRNAINEVRNLQADLDTQAGYLIPPLQFVNRLIKFVDDLVFIRGLSTKMTVTNAQSLGAPSLDSDPSDADWTAELLTGAEDSAMTVGRRDFSPYPLAKRIRISNKLLRLAPNVEGLVMQRFGYKFAVTEEKAFLTGSGAQQPLGVFTPSVYGISTARDVSTGNTTTDITADGLIEAKYGLKQPYMQSGSLRWIFSRPAVKKIRKLKDGVGQYIWQAGLGGTPDTLLDIPVLMSEYCPATFTTGLYVGILGDFSYYWIVESLNMQMQRLDELYAETNQTGFIARRELDAMPVLEEAFVRVKLA